MAKAIHFYREYQHIEELKYSEETEKFTSIFNSLFDALNRRYPAEGIRSSSKDIQVCSVILIDNIFSSFFLTSKPFKCHYCLPFLMIIYSIIYCKFSILNISWSCFTPLIKSSLFKT